MPKTIAITPSWYWPEHVDRVAGIPPFALQELCVDRHARHQPEAPAIVGAGVSVSFGELHGMVQRAAQAIRERCAGAGVAVLRHELDADNVALLLGALSAGVRVRIAGATEDAAAVAAALGAEVLGAELTRGDGSGAAAAGLPGQLAAPAVVLRGRDGDVAHSHRSLLAMVVSMTTFLEPLPVAPWLSAIALDNWDGLMGALLPLYCGVPLVLGWGGDADAMLAQVGDQRPGYALIDLEVATAATRDSRRGVRKARDLLTGMLLTTDAAFDPGDRQRVAKAFRCPALTLFGVAETGPIFVSHPQWYIEESVGIPVTNAHVVPSDPRNGVPIQALWEQVESAEVTVKGPMLMCPPQEGARAARMVDGRFRTGVIASSDANGMIYLLPV